MKKYGIIILLQFLVISLLAQVQDPVSWKFESGKKGEKEYFLKFTASIQPGWHMYAMNLPEGGPIPTSISIDASEDFQLVGEMTSSKKAEEKFDESFGMTLGLFDIAVTFTQKVKVLTDKQLKISGYVNYMCCNDEQCLPPKDVPFEFDISGVSTASTEKTEILPASATEEDTLQKKEIAHLEDEKMQPAKETELTSAETKDERSLLGFFLVAFLLGLAGILTPCVFPMIPMTISFFMQGAKTRAVSITKALIFGISIVTIYTLIGVIFSLSKSGININLISTHWLPNLIFFALFMVFAASFFGLFEIVLPSKLANKADKQVDKGGYWASFFMAVTFVIVSFSCTGPFVGSLLVGAMEGNVLRPTIGMFGFSLALALPFTLLAFFPSLLKNLPKSGGWLNSVKVFFAFILLAFSMKFFTNAFPEVLSRDVFISIWIVVFVLLGLYLLGKIKFSHDSELQHIGVFRLLLVVASFSFAIYLVPGLFGARLTAISSLLPPLSSQQFDLTKGNFVSGGTGSPGNICETPTYSDFLELPYELQGYFDYEQGLACAKQLNKPVLIDFKGHKCSNCKVVENKVWSDPEVLKRLREEFVIIALYLDDPTELPEAQWYTSEIDGRIKKTIGTQNVDFEISRYKTNAMPYYVLMDTDESNLIDPMGFTSNVKEYLEFLDQGIKEFKDRHK